MNSSTNIVRGRKAIRRRTYALQNPVKYVNTYLHYSFQFLLLLLWRVAEKIYLYFGKEYSISSSDLFLEFVLKTFAIILPSTDQ